MLSTKSIREERDGLLVDRDKFPIQIEPGNPFMMSQEYNFLSGELSPFGTFEDIKHIRESDIDVDFFRNRIIELSNSRLNRMPNNIHLLTNLGISHLNSDKIDEAIIYFQKALESDSYYLPAIENLSKAYYLKGEIDTALDICLKIEKLEPSNVKILNNIASLLITKRDLKKAFEYLSQVVRLDPKNIPALHNTATIFLLKREFDKAILYYRRALSIKSDLPSTLNNLGVCFAVRKSYKKAIKHFLASWHLNRQAIGTLCNLAQAYQETGLHDKAIRILENYLRTGFDDKGVRDALAWSYASIKDYKNCLVHLKGSLSFSEKTSDRAAILNNLGTIYHCMKDYKNAEKFYNLCLESKALNSSVVFYNAIRLYFDLDNDDGAKKLIDEALVLFPDDPDILESLGRFYFDTENYEKASELLKRVIEIKPDVIDSYATLSVIEMEINGNTEKAHEILVKGLSHNPDDLILSNNLAYNYLLSGNLKKAREILDKIKNDKDPFLTATRGLLLINEKNVKEGRRLYNLAMTLVSNDKALMHLVEQKKYFELGKYYLKEGNKREARRLLRKVLPLKPKYGYFKNQALELLEII